MVLTEDYIKRKLAPYNSKMIGVDDGYTRAAVLIPLFMESNRWKVLFTMRSNNVQDHKGQVSFPGGAFEKIDQNLEETALRETEEEIGISKENIRIIGCMRSFKSISNYLITPIVGVINYPFQVKLAADEVDSIFSIDLDWLSNPKNYGERDYTRSNGSTEKVLFYSEINGNLVWGITARIMTNFIEIIK
jgi:8-oxo-dGTP pyrophosphatase MutT (NUDIX family)